MHYSNRMLFIVASAGLLFAGVGSADAACPPNSHEDRQVGNVVHCKCDDGYTSRAGQCIMATETYAAALDNCERMAVLRKGFRGKVEELRRWQGNLTRYQREYEAARTEAWRGGLSDVLGVIPGEKAGAFLATKYAKYLPAYFTPAFVTGHAAAKALVSYGGAVSTKSEDSERIKKVGEGHAAIREALLAIPVEAANEQTRKLLGASGHLLDASTKIVAFVVKQQNETSGRLSSMTERRQEWLELGAEIWGVFDPRMAGGLAGTNIALRITKWGLAESALADLKNTMATNWNAQQHLNAKIERWTSAIAEETRVINSYRAFHPEAAACTQS